MKYVYLLWYHGEDGPEGLVATLDRDLIISIAGEYNISGQDHIEKLKKILWQDDRDLSAGEGIHSLVKGWGGLHLQVVMLREAL